MSNPLGVVDLPPLFPRKRSSGSGGRKPYPARVPKNTTSPSLASYEGPGTAAWRASQPPSGVGSWRSGTGSSGRQSIGQSISNSYARPMRPRPWSKRDGLRLSKFLRSLAPSPSPLIPEAPKGAPISKIPGIWIDLLGQRHGLYPWETPPANAQQAWPQREPPPRAKLTDIGSRRNLKALGYLGTANGALLVDETASDIEKWSKHSWLGKASAKLDLVTPAVSSLQAVAAVSDAFGGRGSISDAASSIASAVLSVGKSATVKKVSLAKDLVDLSLELDKATGGDGKPHFHWPWSDEAMDHVLGLPNPRARGGRVRRGETTLVGERGPEIVQLPAGSNVIPAHRSRMALEQAETAALPSRSNRELHLHQILDGREIARSTIRNLDDEEQWGRA